MGKLNERLKDLQLYRRARWQNYQMFNSSSKNSNSGICSWGEQQFRTSMLMLDKQIAELEIRAQQERVDEATQAVIANVSRELSNESGKVATEIAKEIEKALKIKTK